MNGFCMR